MRTFFSACSLAVRDWRHDGLLTVCGVLALVSVLVPLLMLLGIRNGVVTTLQKRLLENPALLAITPTGSGSGYTQAWLETLADDPDVIFVIPKTRDISTTAQLQSSSPAHEGGPRFSPVDLEPTAAGDPLLVPYGAVPPDARSITLSRPAADRLGVRAGDTVTARMGRTTSAGKMESFPLDLSVASVLPLEAEGRVQGFIPLSLLVDMENYKDGYAVADWEIPGDPLPSEARRFARFRLYARDMDAVGRLRDRFTEQGLEVQTSALEIKSFQEISQALTVLFLLIAGAVAAGFAASTGSSVLAGVRRKDKQLGMLRLLGFPGGAVMLFPLVQAQMTAIAGCLAAAGLYACAAYGVDALFSGKFGGAAVSLLPPEHYLLLCVAVCLVSMLAALPAARRAARVEPSDVLRDL